EDSVGEATAETIDRFAGYTAPKQAETPDGSTSEPELWATVGEDPLGNDGDIRRDKRHSAHDPDQVTVDEEEDMWWPWPDQETCLMDITGAFPRALFSESELEVMRWFASKTGSRKLPSIRQVKTSREAVLRVAGSNPRLYQGQCGHLYAATDFPTIIKHEFANPEARSVLHLYPEDGYDTMLKHPRQAKKWAETINPTLAAPMARAADGRDYFVHELAMAKLGSNDDIAPVVIARWYQRDGRLFSKAHPVLIYETGRLGETEFVIDARNEVLTEVALDSYVFCIEDLCLPEVQQQWGLPDPHCWRHPIRNTWRVQAKGQPVYSLPIWLYCDDTSGNVSKKWNKHNSILFVLGGLPREASTQMYNVHFLSTSNIASPLEMMETVADVLKKGRTEGIAVWDCMKEEDALVIPWVLAFQGDNPMSSEFASHIGMKGKYFCRVCHVASSGSGNGAEKEESRINTFITAGTPRTKEETIRDLEAQEAKAFEGAPSSVDGLATSTGTKDKYFQHFVDSLQTKLNQWREEHKGGGERAERMQTFLQDLRAKMPANIFNPVLQIPDFDPSEDSPIEILHVVLLGVVKYWWRDACSRQDQHGKAILKARLSSVEVDGLMISPLRGHTLVHYAGSLIGRDFRTILQVAPQVLHGLIPDAAYEAWLALCRLAPLIFQPEIRNLQSYERRLQSAVEDFLFCTALWTTQWFNKPKFHLFVHLLHHIRRFGPAIMYATETFESYNLVIRLRSINSNKHAPSLDIATSFSHLHAVRHLVSGGYVTCDTKCREIAPRQAGHGVMGLANDKDFLRMMGMSSLRPVSHAGE
ncbi:hypothetical protein BD311DRAFT_852410, partial [Dichomitus squalens]